MEWRAPSCPPLTSPHSWVAVWGKSRLVLTLSIGLLNNPAEVLVPSRHLKSSGESNQASMPISGQPIQAEKQSAQTEPHPVYGVLADCEGSDSLPFHLTIINSYTMDPSKQFHLLPLREHLSRSPPTPLSLSLTHSLWLAKPSRALFCSASVSLSHALSVILLDLIAWKTQHCLLEATNQLLSWCERKRDGAELCCRGVNELRSRKLDKQTPCVLLPEKSKDEWANQVK